MTWGEEPRAPPASRQRRPAIDRCPLARGTDRHSVSRRASVGSKETYNRPNGDPHTADARLTPHDGRVEGNPVEGLHGLSPSPAGRATRKRENALDDTGRSPVTSRSVTR